MYPNTQLKKVLVLASNPKDTSRLRLDQEVREICEGLQRAKKRELYSIQQRWAVRTRDLRQALLDFEPQFVHFCGHGATAGLFLEDEAGNQHLVEPKALANLFELCASHVECVILNACYSEVQAEAISYHVNYVIGMKQAIKDRAAIAFSVGFYDALGAGREIVDSYKFGCNAIELEGVSEYLMPVLKIQGNNESLITSKNWNNEAYVSLHLVQEVLRGADLLRKSKYSHWYPQFQIRTSGNGQIRKETIKPVDFLVEDLRRNIQFLVEVKSGKSRIDDNARFQLRMYLQYSGVRFGVLIDPYLVEIYELDGGRFILKDSFKIEDPERVQPVSNFLRSFLDSVTNAYDSNSYL
jgi:hypothetical protein